MRGHRILRRTGDVRGADLISLGTRKLYANHPQVYEAACFELLLHLPQLELHAGQR
jgi:hypothetical protein